MKRVWTKPELYTEEFLVDQHIAKGCGTTITVKPGESVTGDLCCWQAVSNNGQGHYYLEGVTIYDTNGNGKIDWSEIQDAAKAKNGNDTGVGHQGHGLRLVLPNEDVIEVIPDQS